ncbi:MAG: UDP-2,4-diacetamido-2,4,6-trideoxy-beta-L-altropyranose hydrolase, partial [Zoogloea sp.]|nr:UDP-2,4-diacetamido-2,4,6-trideoxy-beta-L-altropyranose hydrolase [Zoogloea sp.]
MMIVVRADATPEIGSGHVMRCAALGMRLKARGATVHFICAPLPARLGEWLRGRGFGLTELDGGEAGDWRSDLAATRAATLPLGVPDVLIVDHYRLAREWEAGMRAHARRILVIDDLADRDHDCDLLLDQNLHENAETRYARRLPPHARQFLGPRHALLREEFDEAGLERVRDGEVKRLLVFFGGTDPGDQTLKVLDALRILDRAPAESVIVLGPAHPAPERVREQAAGLPGVKLLDATEHMSRLISQADLAIGTCGVAAWERCALGLPTLVVITAENQRDDAHILHRLGAVELLGDADRIGAEDWAEALARTMEDPARLRTMSGAVHEVMHGRRAALAE